MKVARDTWLVFGRYFGVFIHNPAWVALGVLQPVIYFVLFAPLLNSRAPGALSRPVRPLAQVDRVGAGISSGWGLQRVRPGPAGAARHVRCRGSRFQPDLRAQGGRDRAASRDAG